MLGKKLIILVILPLLCLCDKQKETMKLEAMFHKLDDCSDCRSLLKKHFTWDVYQQLKDRKTSNGATLVDCISTGMEHLDDPVGLYAADPESYTVFAPLFDPVIMGINALNAEKDVVQPKEEFGEWDQFKPLALDPEGDYVVKIKMTAYRSINGFVYPPILKTKDRKELEAAVEPVLHSLEGELKGEYFSFMDMTEKTIEKGYFSHAHKKYTNAEGFFNDWPQGRGVFQNNAKTFSVRVNLEEQLEINSGELGSDIGTVYKRLIKGMNALATELSFVRDEKRGYLAFSPTNIGTALWITTQMKLPNIPLSSINELLKPYNLHGEAVPGTSDVYTISNQRAFGMTELQLFDDMKDGILDMIKHAKDQKQKDHRK